MLLLICAALLLPYGTLSFPNVVSEAAEHGKPYGKDIIDANDLTPILQKMHVNSYIRNRYARTIIHSRYLNPKNEPEEVEFSIVLPEQAFITEFIMEVKDKQYKGYVREKDQAKREYTEAVEKGLGAATISAGLRDSNEFTVTMNVQALSKVSFNLTYEHLLEKKFGMYEMVLHLHPDQLVEDFSVEVNINETRPIINIQIPEMQNENEIVDYTKRIEYVTISDLNPELTEKQIIFTPTIEQQKTTIISETTDIQKFKGRFIVRYEVDQNTEEGEIITSDGYFVHFFAPEKLSPLPKHIIFVLDISGSMSGHKMNQLRKAMKVILGECNEEDYISVVTFDSNIDVLADATKWVTIANPKESNLPKPILASVDNIFKAQKTVSELTDRGLTNINDALIVALRLANMKNINNNNSLKPVVIFLSDGEPNVGEQNPNNLIQMVKSKDSAQTIIYTLAVGNDAKEDFLQKLAEGNYGFMRKIYEASDTALQLTDFYNEISSPLLSNVRFKYDENEITNVTKTYRHQILKGSDFAIAGKIKKLVENNIWVEGLTKTGPRTYRLKIKPLAYKSETKKYGSMERLWAYMTIQKLLKNKDSKDDRKKALDLALKYSFVTPITSLVVVKPNGTDEIDLKKINIIKDKNVATYTNPVTPRKIVKKPKPIIVSDSLSTSTNYLTSFSYSKFNFILGEPDAKVTTETYVEEKNELIDLISWIYPYVRDKDSVYLNSTIYFVGDEQTTFDYQSCQIKNENKTGVCKLLTNCKNMIYKLNSYKTFTDNYMCTLKMGRRINYLGVCCK